MAAIQKRGVIWCALAALGGAGLAATGQQKPTDAPPATRREMDNREDKTPQTDAASVAPKANPGFNLPVAVRVPASNYPVPNGAIWASPQGRAQGSGASNEPTTLENALKIAPEGGTIVLRGGTYRASVTLNKRLTLQAAPGEQVWFKGSDIVSNWTRDGALWRRDGWNAGFPPRVDARDIDPKFPLAVNGDMVFVEGAPLRQVPSRAEVAPGAFAVDYETKTLWLGENPGGKEVEVATRLQGVFVGKNAEKATSGAGSALRGLGFTHYAGQGVTLRAPRVVLEGNALVWNGIRGVSLPGFLPNSHPGSGRENEGDYATNCVLRGNLVSFNGQMGLFGNGVHGLRLENNTFSHNNIENFSKSWSAAGAKIIRTDDLVVKNNLFESNYASGLWMDISIYNAQVTRNTVRRNAWMGIWFEISHRGVIAFNLIQENGAGIFVSESSQTQVWNNTLVDNSVSIRVNEPLDRDAKNPRDLARGITWRARDNTFGNNLFALDGAKKPTGKWYRGDNCFVTKEPANLMVSSNDFNAFAGSNPKPKAPFGWSMGDGACDASFPSLSAFQAATGREKNSLEISDAGFLDPKQGDFRLKASSLARGRGTQLPAEVASALEMQSSGKPNIGAF